MKKMTIYVLSNMLLALIGSPHKGVSHQPDCRIRVFISHNHIIALGYHAETTAFGYFFSYMMLWNQGAMHKE